MSNKTSALTLESKLAKFNSRVAAKEVQAKRFTTVELVANATENLSFTYKFPARDGTILNYNLELSNKNPLTFSCNWQTTRSEKGVKVAAKVEIAQVLMQNDKISVVIKDESPLPKNMDKVIKIGTVEVHITYHSEIVSLLAIPHWIDIASTSVKMNQIASIWLVVSNLWRITQSVVDTDAANDMYSRTKTATYTEADYWLAVLMSASQCRNNAALLQAVSTMPQEYLYLLDGETPTESTETLPVEKTTTANLPASVPLSSVVETADTTTTEDNNVKIVSDELLNDTNTVDTTATVDSSDDANTSSTDDAANKSKVATTATPKPKASTTKAANKA